jgi:hypothetical protein
MSGKCVVYHQEERTHHINECLRDNYEMLADMLAVYIIKKDSSVMVFCPDRRTVFNYAYAFYIHLRISDVPMRETPPSPAPFAMPFGNTSEETDSLKDIITEMSCAGIYTLWSDFNMEYVQASTNGYMAKNFLFCTSYMIVGIDNPACDFVFIYGHYAGNTYSFAKAHGHVTVDGIHQAIGRAGRRRPGVAVISKTLLDLLARRKDMAKEIGAELGKMLDYDDRLRDFVPQSGDSFKIIRIYDLTKYRHAMQELEALGQGELREGMLRMGFRMNHIDFAIRLKQKQFGSSTYSMLIKALLVMAIVAFDEIKELSFRSYNSGGHSTALKKTILNDPFTFLSGESLRRTVPPTNIPGRDATYSRVI